MDIDFVILWVDGNDRAGRRRKADIRAKKRMTATRSTVIVIGICFLIGSALLKILLPG